MLGSKRRLEKSAETQMKGKHHFHFSLELVDAGGALIGFCEGEFANLQNAF